MPGHLHLSLTMAQPEENKCKREFSSQKQELGREMDSLQEGETSCLMSIMSSGAMKEEKDISHALSLPHPSSDALYML